MTRAYAPAIAIPPRSAGAVTRGRLTDVERAERAMSGGELQRLIVGDLTNPGLAPILGWEWLHVVPGIRSKGRWWTATTGTLSRWPDLTLVRERDHRLIFAEIKRELEQPTSEQSQVLDILRSLENSVHGAGVEHRIQVFVWRPSDLRDPIETSRIYEALR